MANRWLVEKLHREMRLPVVVAPMFLISGPDLVIAAARAGVIGAFPAPNARTIDDLAVWLPSIAAELDVIGKPGMWAINLIVHRSYERFDAELDLVCEYKPRLVITALGSPKRALERVHGYGGVVFSDAVNIEQAKSAIDAGADGLVLVANGAGGHTGQFSPFAFVEEVRRFWSGPLVLGGGIGSSRGIRAALDLGADFAYMGTRFIPASESLIGDEYRAMLVRSRMQDIVTTAAVTGVPANWMRESLEAAGFTGEMLDVNERIDFSDLHGDGKAWKNIWGAGHGVGHIRSVQKLSEIVDQLCAEFSAFNVIAQHASYAWPRPKMAIELL